MFNAILISKQSHGSTPALAQLNESDLPEGNVTVDIDYSTLNYKDALAITGKGPVVRKFPMVPGIDFAGTVAASAHSAFAPGDKVVLNGWGAGEAHWGGLAGKARVNGDWLVSLPERFSTFQAMSLGTAGYTAMLCAMALERLGVDPRSGDVLVTGAAGGVGSFAVAILARRGFRVLASTGRPAEEAYLRALGAAEIIAREELSGPGRPLGKERWAGAIDTVGGTTLANACASTRYGGVVAACGLAQSMDLPATVAPFILRGITLAGIDSVYCAKPRREAAWKLLATEISDEALALVAHEIRLDQAIHYSDALLSGGVRGRLVVKI